MSKKNECFSYDLQAVLAEFNEVKKTLQKRKYCYDECDSERIKNTFIVVLKADLLNLSNALDTWISNDNKMEASEDDFNDLLE